MFVRLQFTMSISFFKKKKNRQTQVRMQVFEPSLEGRFDKQKLERAFQGENVVRCVPQKSK